MILAKVPEVGSPDLLNSNSVMIMGYSKKASFCRGMPSDAWTGSGSNMREKRITMIDFLDIINTSFYFFGTDFTDYTVFVIVIDIQAPEFLLRTILRRGGNTKPGIMLALARINSQELGEGD